MTDPTPWIVVQQGPDVPSNVLRHRCLRCGDVNDLPLPASIPDVLKAGNAFTRRHRNCKEPKENP